LAGSGRRGAVAPPTGRGHDGGDEHVEVEEEGEEEEDEGEAAEHGQLQRRHGL